MASKLGNIHEGLARGGSTSVSKFESLTTALEGWFEADMATLPVALRRRVHIDFQPVTWEALSAEQRRSRAAQWDGAHDPALAARRQQYWALVCEMLALKSQIERWELVSAPTTNDLKLKECKLAELRSALRRVNSQQRREDPHDLERAAAEDEVARSAAPQRFLAYPAALRRLRERLGATPEELAAWLFVGPETGGLAGYMHANELDPPPRFYFAVEHEDRPTQDFDCIPMMMGCWFRVEDIEQFQPRDRYIGGNALVERWSRVPGIHAVEYIRAKVRESRLSDLHPVFGITEVSNPDGGDFPSSRFGLFKMAEILAIEAEDFGGPADSAPREESGEERRRRIRERVQALRDSGAKGFLKTVAVEEGVGVSRIKQFVYDPPAKSRAGTPVSWASPVSTGARASSRKPGSKT